MGKQIRETLDAICHELGVHYHDVRYRTTGYRQLIEVYLLFPHATAVGEAHRLATLLEERLPAGNWQSRRPYHAFGIARGPRGRAFYGALHGNGSCEGLQIF